jgi:hypothetical protein
MKHRSGAALPSNGPAAAIALVLCALAACNRSSSPPSYDFAPPPDPVARPHWRYAIDDRQGLLGLAVADGVVALVPARLPSTRRADAALVVLDAETGRERFRLGGFGGALAVGGGRIFAADARGSIVALRLRDGVRMWRRTPDCPPPRGPGDGLVANIYLASGDVIVSCPRSALVRLDAATGRKLAASVPLSLDNIDTIDGVLPGVLAVAGISPANGRQYMALLRQVDLHTIGQFAGARLAGVAGHSAIIVRECCFPAGGPWALLRVDVRTGSQTSVALRFDSAYPRPRAIGVTVDVVGTRLFAAALPVLYDYGNALAPSETPRRVLDDLAWDPTFLAGGYAFVRRSAAAPNGRRVYLLDLKDPDAVPRPLVRGGSGVVDYGRLRTPAFVTLDDGGRATTLIRVPDLAAVSVPSGCWLEGSLARAAIAACAQPWRGRGDRPYVARFDLSPARYGANAGVRPLP